MSEPLEETLAHEVDVRPQLELLHHERHGQVVLEVPRTQEHRVDTPAGALVPSRVRPGPV